MGGRHAEIPTGPDGRGTELYLATVIDLYSRRLLGAATGLHPDAAPACEAIKMAVAARGGAEQIKDVIFHTDRGSAYTCPSRTCARCWYMSSSRPQPTPATLDAARELLDGKQYLA